MFELDIIEEAEKQGDSPLKMAISFGRYDVVKTLLEDGADVRYIDKEYLYLGDHFFELDHDDDCLRRAASGGDLSIVKLLVDHGAYIYIQNSISLELAAGKGHLKTVAFLVATIMELANTKNQEIGKSIVKAILAANRNGHNEIIQILSSMTGYLLCE